MYVACVMNHIPPRNRAETEMAQIKAIVDEYPLPDFITGYDVRLGEFEGDPAMWIEFNVLPEPRPHTPQMDDRIQRMTILRDGVMSALLEKFEDRFPYFRFKTKNPEASRSND